MRAAVERVLHDVWSHRGIAASLLYPFSLVYLAIARRRAARTTPVELPVPVVPFQHYMQLPVWCGDEVTVLLEACAYHGLSLIHI